MSLAVLADHMASKGRGPDSMLIHMSPREVQGLQALAMKHGGSLTINPDTGLPEAGFLDKLLPTIIGAGLTFFSGGAISPLMAAGIVGGVQTARTGDIGKGLAAGLGAYGGAGMTSGLTAAGESAIGSQAAGQSYLASSVPSVLEGASPGLAADMAYNLGQAGVDTAGAEASRLAQQAAAERVAAASPFERLSAGAKAVGENPMSFANKDNLKYLAAAAGPAIMAGANVSAKGPQTVTKPGMIRPYSYDPYGGGFTAYPAYEATPKKAAEGGLMGMNAGGYSPGMLDFTQKSEPVVRMAEGGIAGYAPGGYVPTDAEIFDYFKTPGRTDAQIAADMQTFGVSAADIARATGTQGQQADYEKRFVNTLVAPGTDASEFMAATKAVGLQDQALANAMQNAGLSAAGQYALTHNLSDAGGVTGTDFYTNLGYTKGALPGDQGGLEGLYSNINYSAQGLQKQIDAGTLTVAQAQDLARAEAARSGTSSGDIQAATGKTIDTLFKPKTKDTIVGGGGNDTIVGGDGNDKITKKPPVCGPGYELNAAGDACVPITKKPLVCGPGYELNAAGDACVPITKKPLTCDPGYHLNAAGTACVKDEPVIIDWKDCGSGYHWDVKAQACVKNTDVTQQTTDKVDTSTSLVTAADTTLPVGVSGTTGPSIFGGGATVNPNGTITTSPVIPGIPVGGFTGMEQVRKAYTDGGGSLGYTPYVPKTIEEFDRKYNKLTGGSKQAYDYLMGKTPYSPTPVTPTGQIFKPYSEAMGIPQDMTKRKYIFDPVTKTYKVNPDYKPPAYATAGTASGTTTGATGSTDLTDQSKPPTTDPGPGNEWIWDYNSKKWIASEIQKAAGGGLMAMARGGQFDLGDYSDGGRLLRGPGDGVSDSIPASIGNKRPARLADGEFVVPARIVSELGNGSTEAGARKLYAMMDRIQAARRGTVGKGKVAKNSRADKHLPA